MLCANNNPTHNAFVTQHLDMPDLDMPDTQYREPTDVHYLHKAIIPPSCSARANQRT